MDITFHKSSFRARLRTLLLLALIFVGGLQALAQGKIYAVLVGVSQYQNSGMDLTYCHSDAAGMYNLLREFTTTDRLRLLTNSEARHSNVVSQTQQLFSRAAPNDIVIFFFSGHGNRNLFCLHDRDLYFATLQQIFRDCRATRKLIFADACHSGTLRQPGRNQATTNTNMGANVLLFLSSRSEQYSFETSSLQGGIFTHYLISGLKGQADANRDNIITAIELFNYVNPRVKEMSNNTQVPVMWGNFDRNMVIINRRR